MALDESTRWKALEFPDLRFERFVYTAAAIAFLSSWPLQVLLRPSIGPDRASFFVVPAAVGIFLASLSILAGAGSRKIIEGFSRAIVLFAFFPATAIGLTLLLNLEFKTEAAGVLSAVPSALLAPAGYRWIKKDYVRGRHQSESARL